MTRGYFTRSARKPLQIEGCAPAARQSKGGRCVRDPDREAAFIADAATGLDGFAGHVAARLELGEREYGSAWADRGARALVLEALEEAADLAAWLALADQALDAEPPPRDDEDMLRCLLALAAADAGRAHANLAGAATLLAPRERKP